VARNCPARRVPATASKAYDEGTVKQLLMQGIKDLAAKDLYQFAQTDRCLPKTWILLDNQSTVKIFYNKDQLTNIQAAIWCMQVHFNARWAVTDLIGHLPGCPGKVWYNQDGIANILLRADMEKYFCVCYDSLEEKPDGTKHHFQKMEAGLYYVAQHGGLYSTKWNGDGPHQYGRG
jgi:hypothetical protein